MSKLMDIMAMIASSKTLIFNILVAAAAVFTALQGTDLIAAHPQAVAWIGSAIGVVNLGLRWLTVMPLSDKIK